MLKLKMVFNLEAISLKNSYKTEQRKIIQDYLFENEKIFVNAEQILEYMKKNNQIVGLTTIYRYLKILEEKNNVRTEVINHTKHLSEIY